MDSKSKSWAGRMYHQFESICHDVDGFMTKDTLQFVENQAQSVGKNVRRLYSSVKDRIPPSEEDSNRAKPEAQQVRSNEDEIKDHINDAKNPLSLSDDTLENSLTFDEEKSQPIETDSCPGSKTNVVREEHHDLMAGTNCVALTTSSNSEAKNDRNSFITFSDYTDGFSDASISGWSFEDNFPFFEEAKSSEDKIPSSPTVSFADKDCQCNDPTIDSHTSGFDSTEKDSKEDAMGHNILTRSYSNTSKSLLSESTQSSDAVKCDDHSCNSHASSSAAIDWLPSELPNIATHISDIDGEMETIDLSSDEKTDRAPIVLDRNIFGRKSLSYRRKDFRYYKGLMKDAIASRKRLSKEYEKFSVMYGDIDEDLLRDFEQHSLPSSSSSLPSEMVENEWELL